MKYLLMIWMNPNSLDGLTDEQKQMLMDHADFHKTIIESGELVLTQALAPPSDAVTQRPGAVPAVTDGPFIEAKEFLAGYYMVECSSHERAVELASLMPEAPYIPIEVRPIQYSMDSAGREN